MRLPHAASPPLPRASTLIPIAATGGAAFFALLLGIGTVAQTPKAVALAALAVFAPVTLISLPLGLALWATTLSLGHVVGLGLASSIGGLGLIAVWFGVMSGRRERIRDLLGAAGPALFPAVGLLLWLAITLAWAQKSELVKGELLYWALCVLLLVIVATTLRTAEQVRLVAAGFVGGAVISVILGAAMGDLTTGQSAIKTAQATEGRFEAAGNDPNELAAGLIAAIAVAVGMLAGVRGPRRMLIIVSLAIMGYGAAATQSRGGLVAAAVCVVATIVLARGHRLQALGLAALVGMIATFALASTPGALDRITSFDGGGTGRSDLWAIAWRMSEDHPITGVGLNQFREESTTYVRDLQNLQYVDLIVDTPRIVHNTYLQLLAETGIVGLLGFLLVSVLGLVTTWRAAGAWERAGRPDLQALTQGLLIGQIGFLVAAFFLSIGNNFRLWLLLGLGSALLTAARKEDRGSLNNARTAR